MSSKSPLVHVRTPTFRRPEALRRCLECLITQTHGNWLCDVYDDDPEGSARTTIAAIGDSRIRFHQNTPQRFASRNIDACFTRQNPHHADYFCVAEDDNYLLPTFIEENIRLCEREAVELVLRNQLTEFRSGTADAYLSEAGLLDQKFDEALYAPDTFHLCILADMGVSNGGLFWSRNALTDLEIHAPCSATLQEYLRTLAIAEPVFVALEPLAVWAENGEDTERNRGMEEGYFSRELELKASVAKLQRLVWSRASRADQDAFRMGRLFRYSDAQRALGLVKAHIDLSKWQPLGVRESLRVTSRSVLIRLLGSAEAGVDQFLETRSHLTS